MAEENLTIDRLKRAQEIFAEVWPPIWGGLPRFEKADAEILAHFLSTPTGQKLVVLLRGHEQAQSSHAVHKVYESEWSSSFACGFACGFRALLAFLFSLAGKEFSGGNAPEDVADDQPPQNGAGDRAGRYAP